MITAFIGMLSSMCSLFSMKYIPASKTSLITNCYPVIGMVLAALVLKEVINRIDILSIAIMLVGLVFITKHNTQSSADLPYPGWGYFLALLSCVLFALASTGLSKMNQSLHFLMYPFYYCLSVFPFAILISSFSDDLINFQRYHTLDVIMMSLYGVGSLLSQLFMSVAYKYGQSSQLAPLWNLMIVFNFSLEWGLLGYHFAATDYMGAAIMLLSFLIPVLSRVVSFKR